MGITVRREPVNYKIPDYPDYEYLDVTDFRGIEMSDNPFSTSKNTASDALNVYVDEVNVLTTRPRLSKIIKNPKEKVVEGKRVPVDVYGVYSTSKGYLYHHENGMCLVNIDYPHESIDITGIFPSGKKLNVFEQNGKIYILDGSSYKEIGDDFVCKEVTPYIPNTRNYGSNLDPGTADESYNFLTDKYTERYVWDGTWNPEDIKKYDTDVLTNEAEHSISMSVSESRLIQKIQYDQTQFKTDTFDGLKRFVYETGSGFTTPQDGFIGLPSDLPDLYDGFSGDVASDGKTVAVVCYATSEVSNVSKSGGLYAYRNDAWLKIASTTDYSFMYEKVRISDDGNTIVTLVTTPQTDWKAMYLCIARWSEQDNNYKVTYFKIEDDGLSHLSGVDNLLLSKSNDVVALGYNKNNHWLLQIITNLDSPKKYEYERETGWGTPPFAISPDGQYVFVGRRDFVLINTVDNSTRKLSDKISDLFVWCDIFAFAEDNPNKIYCLQNTQSESEGWILLDNEFKKDIPVVQRLTGITVQNKDDSVMYAIDDGVVVYDGRQHRISKVWFDFNNKEPLLQLETHIASDNDFYKTWYKFNSAIKYKFLTTRFNKEVWFAGKNYLFWTEGGDASYIPNAAELNDTPGNITGFNLASDNLLVVYKDDYIYTVTIDDDGLERVFNSKNTVGNNAYGGTIVSAYSEIPLQIAYDGIYGLRQIQNVQSDERISELMSENISKKWLNESKETIKNCKTLNRLYWTYFILSYKDLTKIYLLDNRNNSWFYWELPIEILNAFVRDDVTEGDADRVVNVLFADVLGNIYVLKTSDQINKYNPNLTEYYDDWYPEDDPKIIPWFWRSQIMSLGTTAYAKKLDTTTFITTDTDETDEYGLRYKFRIYRKEVGETKPEVITGDINYVKSITKRTNILRFKFLQIELSNIVDDLNNNKLRLVGLDLKYEILGGVQ